MTYTKWKLDRTDTAGATTTLATYYDPILEVNLGEDKDSFSFKVSNGNSAFDNYFQPRDKITISRVVNTETITTADVLMVGTVSDLPLKHTFNSDMLSVKGYNYSEAVTGALTFVDATVLNIPNAIQAAIANVAGTNTNFNVTWHPDNPSVKRSDGSAFPTVGKKYFYKPIRQMMEELSANAKTGDGNYYWYVNNNNQLVWDSETSFASDVFDDTVDAYKSLSIKKDSKDIVNFIVGKGGITPAGQPITRRVTDYNSIAKNGYKYMFFIDDTVDVGALVKEDLIKDGSDDAAQYPDLSSSFTTSWLASISTTLTNGTVMTAGSAVTINTGTEANNQSDYNQALKKEIETRLIDRMGRIIEARSNGTISISLALTPGQKNWRLGYTIEATLGDFGGTKTLRIHEVQFTTNIDTFTLKEDRGSL